MISIHEQIRRLSTKKPVIATSYQFDFQTVNDLICENKGNRPGSSIIVDKNHFSSEENLSFEGQGYNYFVYPTIKTSESFHPKLISNIEDGCFNFLLGSHNLTWSGINRNLELTAFYSLPIIQNYSEIFDEISNFYSGISHQISDVGANYVKLEIQNIIEILNDPSPYEQNIRNGFNFYFLHTFSKSLFEQILEIVPDTKKVTICSPFLTNNEDFFDDFISNFGNSAEFIVDFNNTEVTKNMIGKYNKHRIKSIQTKGRRLHAKLVVFHTANGDWVLFGSPNFTAKAFYYKANYGGNVESAILYPPGKCARIKHYK
jgi:hypothetical protein